MEHLSEQLLFTGTKLLNSAALLRKFIAIKVPQIKSLLYSSSFGKLQNKLFCYSSCGESMFGELYCYSCSRSLYDIPLGYRQNQIRTSHYLWNQSKLNVTVYLTLFYRYIGDNPQAVRNSHKLINLPPGSKSKPKVVSSSCTIKAQRHSICNKSKVRTSLLSPALHLVYFVR